MVTGFSVTKDNVKYAFSAVNLNKYTSKPANWQHRCNGCICTEESYTRAYTYFQENRKRE